MILAMPGDTVSGARIIDVLVHRGQDAVFVAAEGLDGPMVLIAPTALADALGRPTGAVDIARRGLHWSVTPSRLVPLKRWPPHVDLRRWVEDAFGPAEADA